MTYCTQRTRFLASTAAVGSLFGLAALSTAFGAGFDLPDQDGFTTGRGMTFVATADNPSAIYFNPAGITQIKGNNLRAGLYTIDLEPSFKPPAGSPIGNKTFHSDTGLNSVPQFFYTYTPDEKPVSFGFGVYSPFGLSSHWPNGTGFRTVGTQGSLKYVTANPIMAIKLSDHFSIGGGVTINYANTDLRQGLFWPTQPFDGFRFAGDGWGVGYDLGALWQANEKLFFGASFRSSTDIKLTGHTTAHNDVAIPGLVPTFSERIPASTDFQFPLKMIVGVSYRPTPKWNLEFDADYTDWNQVQTLNIHQKRAPLVLPQNIPFVLNWQSSWYYEFGATRFFDNGLHLSAGYIFNENSMPTANYQPIVADLNRHFLSAGVGWSNKRWDFDISYQFGIGESRKVTGTPVTVAGQNADGTYGFISHALAVSAGIKF